MGCVHLWDEAGNQMSGEIPTELGNLELLENLDLRKCGINASCVMMMFSFGELVGELVGLMMIGLMYYFAA